MVWDALQNELPAVARRLQDIKSIKCLERKQHRDGHVHTVHLWTARSGLPESIDKLTDGRSLSWTERTVWRSDVLEAHWTVRSQLLGKTVSGAGVTRLTPAMGGNATRITFAVNTSVESRNLGPLSGVRWSDGLSSAATAVLTKTLQDLGLALESFLSERTGRT